MNDVRLTVTASLERPGLGWSRLGEITVPVWVREAPTPAAAEHESTAPAPRDDPSLSPYGAAAESFEAR